MRIVAAPPARFSRFSFSRFSRDSPWRMSALARFVVVTAAIAAGWVAVAPAAPLVVIPPVNKPATRPAGAAGATAVAAPAVAAKKPIQWMTNFTAAFTFAQKQDKMILAYFSSSDADEWVRSGRRRS